VGWANVHAIDVKFSHDLTRQKSFKLVRVILKIKRWTFFGTQCICVCDEWLACTIMGYSCGENLLNVVVGHAENDRMAPFFISVILNVSYFSPAFVGWRHRCLRHGAKLCFC